MAKPILFTVDDDPEVLRAIERDLRHEYGSRFRIMRADSGATALKALSQLKQRNEPLALLLVDHRMPHMTGMDLLEQAITLFPHSKRVLLTAYADTDVAIRAINKIKIDYYLLKPWDPPEERLYPVLQDLLDDWQSSYRPPFEGIQLIGYRWSAESHQVKDFLARNQVPYKWLDIEIEEVAQLSRQFVSDPLQLPLVLFPDGTHLVRPTNLQIADKIGLHKSAELPFYDLIIVGAGPAGLAAAVYGASEGLRTVMIEREAPGGQAGTSSRIENYLGFPVGLSGADLARRAVAQARRFGVEILTPQEVKEVSLDGSYKIVTLTDNTKLNCHALLIATGVSYRKLDVPGIEELTGAGVYYGAAMTEAFSCKDEEVTIIGGANSAGQAALYLARYACNVTMVVRGDSLAKGMSQYLVDQIEATEKIKVRLNSKVTAVEGRRKLESVTIANTETGKQETIASSALFILIGAIANTDWLAGIVERDENGFIMSGLDMLSNKRTFQSWPLDREPFMLETSVPGIFVAGDVRHGSIKRIASAVGSGSIAVQMIHQYLSTL